MRGLHTARDCRYAAGVVRRSLPLVVGTALLLVACGGTTGDDTTTEPPSPTIEVTTPSRCGAGPIVEVEAGGAFPEFFFRPFAILACTDQRLEITNNTASSHDFTLNTPTGRVTAAVMDPGEVVTTDRLGALVGPGTYDVTCERHSLSAPHGPVTLEVVTR